MTRKQVRVGFQTVAGCCIAVWAEETFFFLDFGTLLRLQPDSVYVPELCLKSET